MAVYYARRFLWKAQVEGIERLEHYTGQPLAEREEDLRAAKKAAEEAEKKAAEEVGDRRREDDAGGPRALGRSRGGEGLEARR